MVSRRGSSQNKADRLESPLIASIAARIVARIQDRTLPAGQVLPSERELSAEFRASRGVIRSVIRELASQGWIDVKPRCRPVVLPPARPAAVEKRHIGIWIWPNTADYAAASILKGIQRANLGKDLRLVIATAVGGDWDSIFDSEARFLESIADDPEAAGAIVWYLGGERNRGVLEALRRKEIPTVFVDRLPPESFPADFVGTHNEFVARRAVQRLLDAGHRNVALLSNIEGVSSVREREDGYRRALQDAGVPVREEYVLRDLVDGPEGVESALDVWLNLDEPPTAIFAVNDHIALQVCEALQGRGVSVPERMSVIGFDGLLRWVPGGGHLTTFLQDFERIGQLAAETVMHRMRGGTPEVYRHVLLDAPLLERGTVAAPSSNVDSLPRTTPS